MVSLNGDYKAEIERLKTLDAVEYDRQRKDVADQLGIRTSTLDSQVEQARPIDESQGSNGGNELGLFEPQPWPEEVDGDALADDIKRAISRHVVMSQAQAVTVSLWVIHAHAYECWRHTPRLGITAPEKGCGKSTLLDVLMGLVPKGLKTENLSTATMFRVVDGYQPTLLIDEFDTFLKRNEELRGALNAGHARGGRHLRCEGDDNEVRGFKTFAPAALAGIGSLPPTLADRSIPILLQKRMQDELLEELTDEHLKHLNQLASQIARWCDDHQGDLATVKPELPPDVINRSADNLRPLLAIAETIGGDWPELARQASFSILAGTNDDGESIGVRLLADIRTVFGQTQADKLPSKSLCQYLHAFEDRPWSEYGKREQPITPSQLARLLKSYGIAPGTIRWNGETPKGYQLSAFKDAFSRYLPVQNATPPQPPTTNGLGDIPKRHKNSDVAAKETPGPAPSNGCGVVAARIPPSREKAPTSNEPAAHLTTQDDDVEEREALMNEPIAVD